MKKFFKYLVPVLLCLAVAACQKETPANDEEVPANENVAPADENVPEGYVKLTFTVVPEVKTSVSGNTVSFEAGDIIKIYWDGGSAVSDEVDLSSGSAKFTATVAADKSAYYAVYPATTVASISSETLNVTVPQSQTGRFADADILVAKSTSENLVLSFHHAVSLLHFSISSGNSRGITRAQFVDLANNSVIHGDVAITFNGTDIDDMAHPAFADNDVIDITAIQEGDDNYIAVLPGKSLDGFGLRLGTASAWLPGIVGEKSIDLSTTRPKLSNIDNKINDGDWYIMADGTGNGTSWATAGGPELLQSLMGSYSEYQDNYKNLARGWRIDGKTVKIAEGEYAAPGSNGYASGFGNISAFPNGISYTLEGGYTESGVKNVATAKTIFGTDDDSNPSSSRAFFFYHGVSATLKDLVIKNNQRAHDGGAIYLIESPLLTAEGCTFEKNVANAASRNGGAIYVKSSKLSLRNCAFKENTSGADGGAILLLNSNLSAQDVVFESNSCRTGNTALPSGASNNKIGQGGGAIAIKAEVSNTTVTAENPVEVTFNGCTFENNHATYSAGGAFYSMTSHLKLTADKCKFIGNKSNGNYAGAVFAFEQPSSATEANLDYAFFNACEFRGNAAQNFTSYFGPHIAFVHYSYTCLGFNNCLFYGNSTTSSLYALYTRGSLIFANSTFVGSNSKGSTSLINAANVAESYPVTVYNSIMLNTSTNRLGFTTNDWTSDYLNYNFNLFGTYQQPSASATNVQITALPSGNPTTYDNMADGMSFYAWSGSVDGFTLTDKTAIKNAIEGNAKFGTKFSNWLASIKDTNNNDALDVDIRGVKRNGSYWPGSYQAN